MTKIRIGLRRIKNLPPRTGILLLIIASLLVAGAFSQQNRILRQLPSNQMGDRTRDTLEGKVYSLATYEGDIREVLISFSRTLKLNIVVDPEVRGNVTVDLKDVTLDEALENLLTPLGFDYKKEDNFIRVFKPKIQTRHFNVNFVVTRRTGSRTTSAATVATGGYGGYGGGSGLGAGTGVGVAGGMSGGGMGGGGGSSTSVTGTDETDIWRELEIGIGSVLYGGSGGSYRDYYDRTIIQRPGELGDEARGFTINRQAGVVTVSDYPENLTKVAKYLEIVQAAIERQVLIQARIVEVILSNEFRAGINWSVVSQHFVASQNLANAGGVFQIGVMGANFNAVIDLLSTQGSVNVLASPMTIAMNNTPSIMRVGTQDVFFSTTSLSDSTSGRIIQTTETPTAITEGVVLSVTPQISSDGYVTMNVNPSITERTGTATSPNGNSVPILSVRETDTVVKVKEGETIVIGGLIRETERIEKSGVPGLKSIPLLGRIFQRTSRGTLKSDLAILLTPTIMTPDRIGDVAREEMLKLERLKSARTKP